MYSAQSSLVACTSCQPHRSLHQALSMHEGFLVHVGSRAEAPRAHRGRAAPAWDFPRRTASGWQPLPSLSPAGALCRVQVQCCPAMQLPCMLHHMRSWSALPADTMITLRALPMWSWRYRLCRSRCMAACKPAALAGRLGCTDSASCACSGLLPYCNRSMACCARRSPYMS